MDCSTNVLCSIRKRRVFSSLIFLFASLMAFVLGLHVFSIGSSGMLNAIQALSVQLREVMTM